MRLPGQAGRRHRRGRRAYGAGVLAHALLRGELLEAGSPDERFVEDDGSVLVLATPGSPSGVPSAGLRGLSYLSE